MNGHRAELIKECVDARFERTVVMRCRSYRLGAVAAGVAVLMGCGSTSQFKAVSAIGQPTQIMMTGEVRTALQHQELIAIANPMLGAIKPGDRLTLVSPPSAPVISVAVDGHGLSIARGKEGVSVAIPTGLSTGAHSVLVRQSSKFGAMEVSALFSVQALVASTSAPSAGRTPLSGGTLDWKTVGFDTTLPDQGDLGSAFDLADGSDGVALVASGSRKVTALAADGHTVSAPAALPAGLKAVGFGGGQLVAYDKSGTSLTVQQDGAVVKASRAVANTDGLALSDVVGASQVYNVATDGAMVRSPFDGFWYTTTGSIGALTVSSRSARILLSLSEKGSIEAQWPDGATARLQIAPNQRLTVLDSLCEVASGRCVALIQTPDRVVAVETTSARQLAAIGELPAPSMVSASRYLAFAGSTAMAFIPSPNGIQVTALVGGGKS